MIASLHRTSLARKCQALIAVAARPIRFAFVGGTSGLIQLALLHVATVYGWNAILAEIVAIFCAAQVNFLLNTTVTWRDRHTGAARQTLRRRWLAFHGSITGTALLNISIFTVAHMVMPALVASALGIVAVAAVNFVTFDRLVFRPLPAPAV